MSSFPEDLLLEKLIECQYRYPEETLHDVIRVRAVYKDLRLHVDYYSSKPEVKGRRLVYLAGTIPVLHKEYQYNTPVCLWLHENHPGSQPRCSVQPSVAMVINRACPWVDAKGLIKLPALDSWDRGVSNLNLLIAEMRKAFQKITPLYARTPPTLENGEPGLLPGPSLLAHSGGSSSSPMTARCPQDPSRPPQHPDSQSAEPPRAPLTPRSSYTDDLLCIDFSPQAAWNPFLQQASTPSNPSPFSPSFEATPPSVQATPRAGEIQIYPDVNLRLSRLQLEPHSGPPTTGSGHQDPGSGHVTPSGRLTPGSGQLTQSSHPVELQSVSSKEVPLQDKLPAEKAADFWKLMTLQSQDFQPRDVLEALQLNKDLPSALKFLSHECPICQEKVTYSKMITMTHCPCELCVTCFKASFTTAIKEKTIDKVVCPLCCSPDIRGRQGMEDAMEYFNLLDSRIRHFLDPQIHDLFQKKLRDRALQDMPNFRWCAHCSFGMLHEADRLRMDCPNCRKSTCSQCKSHWIPEHQGVSCEDFKRWQLQHDPNRQQAVELERALLRNKIECPHCHQVFHLSRGGCLHFSCIKCLHEFCGSCGRPFTTGPKCHFSADCASRGLHAHHPRNCLYHLRDWSLARLQLLLQCYKVSPSGLVADPACPTQTSAAGVCMVLEVPEDGSSEEPCGRPALAEHSGLCGLHLKERLVEVVRQAGLDPATLYGRAELEAELQRWCVMVSPRAAGEEEPQYIQRLRKSLARNIPLGKRAFSSSSQPSSSNISQPGFSSSSSSSSHQRATTAGP